MALAAAAVASPAFAQEAPDSAGFVFTDIVTVPTNSVKDQNKSGTCWAFSGLTTLEDNVMRKGGPELNLAEMFVVRNA